MRRGREGSRWEGRKGSIASGLPIAGWDPFLSHLLLHSCTCVCSAPWSLLAERLLYHPGRHTGHFSIIAHSLWHLMGSQRRLPVWALTVQIQGAIQNTENHKCAMIEWSLQNHEILIRVTEGRKHLLSGLVCWFWALGAQNFMNLRIRNLPSKKGKAESHFLLPAVSRTMKIRKKSMRSAHWWITCPMYKQHIWPGAGQSHLGARSGLDVKWLFPLQGGIKPLYLGCCQAP